MIAVAYNGNVRCPHILQITWNWSLKTYKDIPWFLPLPRKIKNSNLQILKYYNYAFNKEHNICDVAFLHLGLWYKIYLTCEYSSTVHMIGKISKDVGTTIHKLCRVVPTWFGYFLGIFWKHQYDLYKKHSLTENNQTDSCHKNETRTSRSMTQGRIHYKLAAECLYYSWIQRVHITIHFK
jgi:hypothetical protein